MATWSSVQEHMRDSYRLKADEPRVMSMSLKYDGGRTQRVVVRSYESDEQDMVEIKSPFAMLGGADPLELLRENGRLPLGAVALAGEVFVLVHNVALADLDVMVFDLLLKRVAWLADRLEAKHAKQDAF
jgi:hypothetical protein